MYVGLKESTPVTAGLMTEHLNTLLIYSSPGKNAPPADCSPTAPSGPGGTQSKGKEMCFNGNTLA